MVLFILLFLTVIILLCFQVSPGPLVKSSSVTSVSQSTAVAVESLPSRNLSNVCVPPTQTPLEKLDRRQVNPAINPDYPNVCGRLSPSGLLQSPPTVLVSGNMQPAGQKPVEQKSSGTIKF